MIDRRVRIVGKDAAAGDPNVFRMSALRDRSAIVILGEPGIGKTTLLKTEAAADGASIIDVRGAVDGFAPPAGSPLYLDALDEYRIDGSEADKVARVAGLIRDLAPPRWRLTCRAEDWRQARDQVAVGRVSATGAVTVVQLLPLLEDEAVEVLTSMGEADAAGFVAEARRGGAASLLESPLSLRLLRTVVAKDRHWPATRFELFNRAVEQFAYEHNDLHAERDDRHAPAAILAAAERTALLLLATGAGAVWRSQAPPPADSETVVIPTGALDLPTPLVNDMLDTPLFAGESTWFEPMHRAVAEFLAGRALAIAVKGGDGRAAIPLGRALALVTGPTGKPPIALRGVYAWFAAHLARAGDAVRARELVDRDALSVLAYGDAAAFDTATRLRLFERLDRDDPYFLGSETLGNSTVLGGLADDDMADTFLAILRSPQEDHKLAAVFDILQHGRPLAAVRPMLHRIIIDPKRPEWQRARAIDAWLPGEADPAAARRALFDALASEPVSTTREALRAKLLAALPPGHITPVDVKAVLAGFLVADTDFTVMRLWTLDRRLVAEPMPALFDEPVAAWLPDEDRRRQSIEVNSVLDHALAAVIKSTPDAEAARIWRWSVDVREEIFDALRENSAAAVKAWLTQAPGRPAALFDAILADDDPAHQPWVPAENFLALTGAQPGGDVLAAVRARADAAIDHDRRARLTEVAIAVARLVTTDPEDFFATNDWLLDRGDTALAGQLTVSVPDEHRIRRQQRRQERSRRDVEVQRQNVEYATPHVEALRAGREVDLLHRLAVLYLQVGDGQVDATGRDRLTADTDEAIAAAALDGFKVVIGEPVAATSEQLGASEARGHSEPWELAILAGVAEALASERPC